MFKRIVFVLPCVLSLCARACDSCGRDLGDPARGGGSGITAGIGDLRKHIRDMLAVDGNTASPESQLAGCPVPDFTKAAPPGERDSKPRRWSLDTVFEYRSFKRPNLGHALALVQSGRDQHGYMDDFFANERIGCQITGDLAVGIGGGFRHLRKLNVDDADALGRHDFSSGMSDPQFDVKFRFKRQTECFPLDLAVFGAVKTPWGRAKNRLPGGEFFEVEDQPGTGSWNGTLGLAASRGWGRWGASWAGSYTFKGEGARGFKEGDLSRLSISASRSLLPDNCGWNLYASCGAQGMAENKARQNGVKDADHGGQFIYVIPGISAKPAENLVLSVSAPIPVYQEENGTHQKQNYNLTFGIGVRF